jgi:hypothetical protein
VKQLLRFGWVEAQCCLFAVRFFLGLAFVRLVPLPVATVHEHVSALHRLLGTSTRPRLVARLATGR